MKLYVWHPWTYPINTAIAIAASPKQAKQQLIEDGIPKAHWNKLQLLGSNYEEYELDKPMAACFASE
jgi:hypothetical protein